jgi:Xaa-Pro aminopeptidase
MEGIPELEYRDRVKRCQELARERGWHAILAYSGHRFSMSQGIEDGQNLRYLVGFTYPTHEIQSEDVVVPYHGSENLLVIPTEGDPSLIISTAESERVKKQTWIGDVRTTSDEFADSRSQGMAHITSEILNAQKNGKLGFAGDGFPMDLYLQLTKRFHKTKFVDCTHDLNLFRVIKTQNELRIMRKAAEIADEGVRALLTSCKPGVTEFEIHLAVEKAMFEAGGDGPWSVILSGPRSVIPYISPDYTQRQLRDGDMVYADIGTELMGYHSDIQPAYIVGRGSEDQLALIKTSQKMIRAMIDATRPGTTDTQILQTAYEALTENPFRDYVRTSTFGHGYGVGLDPPDLTGKTLSLSKSKQLILRENMVLCYEPGIFVPGLGGAAIEDEVVITADGCQVISRCAERAQEFLLSQRSIN